MTVTPKPAAPTSGFKLIYDAWNRLTKIREVDECGCPADTVAEYAYNGLNWRVKKVVPVAGGSEIRRYYFTASWQAFEERVNGASFPERQYLWGLRYIDDLLLRDRDTNSDGSMEERLFPTQDANWNVTSLFSTSRPPQERYAYSAYGVIETLDLSFERLPGSAYFWETFYCGYRYDAAVGLHIVRYRWLCSAVGRWLSRDKFGPTPASNLYCYANNGPMGRQDPSGLMTCEENCDQICAAKIVFLAESPCQRAYFFVFGLVLLCCRFHGGTLHVLRRVARNVLLCLATALIKRCASAITVRTRVRKTRRHPRLLRCKFL